MEQSLAAFERNEMTRPEFVRILISSIEALEGVQYRVRVDLRAHVKNIEREGYLAEEGFESNAAQVKANLASWLKELKALYGACNQ